MILETSDWIPFYKFDEQGRRAMAQQTYEPLISPDRTMFCANYEIDNKYQFANDPDRKGYTEEVLDWFFMREVTHFVKFKSMPWCPEIIDIQDRKIFFKWQGYSCNELIQSGRLEMIVPDWRDQLHKIMKDCYDSGTYKLTMYPHCHFVQDGILKTFDMYGCVDRHSPLVPRYAMDGIIHETARFRLEETDGTDTDYNLEKMFKRSLSTHVLWGNENMTWIYNDLFGVEHA